MVDRIGLLTFMSHVLALLCIGLRSSSYHFRLCFWWWLLYGWWPLRLSWVLAPISRSVQTSSTIRCETPIYIILYVLRGVRTLFMYYFLGIRYFLLYCYDNTLLRSFGRLRAHDYTFWWNLCYQYLCLWVICLLKQYFENGIKCFYYPLRLNV